ncbi:DUF805 domain-containing protein [Sphingomicrobium flavum]|uniref:DUF805 domain-containing protein n=1 Tax=Sphingomicrobium flavum TaxID=1229164 RepID=UPI0021ADA1D3|nr:DUF805 domain-containing protein [Sphingomicrobium flavum]
MLSPIQWAFLPLEKYFQLHGRSPRAEYWWFWLLYMVVGIITALFDELAGLNDPHAPFTLSTPVSLTLLVPSITVTVRRLHDINKSGWLVLGYGLAIYVPLIVLFLTPVGWVLLFATGGAAVFLAVGAIILIGLKFLFMMVQDSNPGDNLYGPNPYGLQYGF